MKRLRCYYRAAKPTAGVGLVDWSTKTLEPAVHQHWFLLMLAVVVKYPQVICLYLLFRLCFPICVSLVIIKFSKYILSDIFFFNFEETWCSCSFPSQMLIK